MEKDFDKIMPFKSNAELQNYLDTRSNSEPEAVQAAYDELKHRGKVFTDEEKAEIETYIQKMKEEHKPAGKPPLTFLNSTWQGNTVTDKDAPELYSKIAILIFSILTSTFIGTILMAMNLWRLDKKRGIPDVLIFGVLFMAAESYISGLISQGATFLLIFFNILGALIINNYFWRKYIGDETRYRTRSVVAPAIICIAVIVIVAVAVLLDPNLAQK